LNFSGSEPGSRIGSESTAGHARRRLREYILEAGEQPSLIMFLVARSQQEARAVEALGLLPLFGSFVCDACQPTKLSGLRARR
jgi:hypothetical protein